MKTSAIYGESGYERIANDAYWTPEWCTEVLLDRVSIPPRVWEPACGQGHICRVLGRRNITYSATDLIDHGFGRVGVDFLAVNNIGDATIPACASIITNPPYKLAEAFIRKALDLTGPYEGRVAMLLRNEYDSAAGRRDLFEHPAFYKKIVLTKRPRWSAENKASPRHNFAWFLWCWNPLREHRAPTMEWAP